MQKSSDKYTLLLIFIIALLLRAVGFDHGFPFVFHPDEPAVIRTALALRFYLNPGHFDWPHLYMYLNYFLYMGFTLVRNFVESSGYRELVSTYLPYVWNDSVIFYALTRLFTAFLGALTVVPIYLTGKKLFSEKVGIFAALGFAVIPFHVWHSHYALIDIPTTFFIAYSMYFAAGILQRDDSLEYAGAGTYVGLAASTKYNGGLAAITVPIAHIIRIFSLKEKKITFHALFQLFLSGLMAFLAFIIGTPYSVLDYSTFSRTDGAKGAFWQFTNVGSVSLSERLPKFLNDITFKLSDDFGYTLLTVFVAVFAILLVRLILKKVGADDKYLWFLVISGLFLMFYISGFERSRSQYFLIAYPYVAVVFGYAINSIETFFNSRVNILGLLLILILFSVPSYMSFLAAYKFYNNDSRLQLQSWLTSNLKPDQNIIYDSNDLTAVMDKFSNKKVRKDNPPSVSNGYFISNLDDNSPVLSNFREVYIIDNKYKLGPKIGIYTSNVVW